MSLTVSSSFLLRYTLCVLSRSVVSDSATPQNVARQAPLYVGFFQAATLEWVVISYSRDSS